MRAFRLIALVMLLPILALAACGSSSADGVKQEARMIMDNDVAFVGQQCATPQPEDQAARSLILARKDVALPKAFAIGVCDTPSANPASLQSASALSECVGVADPLTAETAVIYGPIFANASEITTPRPDSQTVRSTVTTTRDEATAAKYTSLIGTAADDDCALKDFYNNHGYDGKNVNVQSPAPAGIWFHRQRPSDEAVSTDQTAKFVMDVIIARTGRYVLRSEIVALDDNEETLNRLDGPVIAAMLDKTKR